jgi:hypothetical protein
MAVLSSLRISDVGEMKSARAGSCGPQIVYLCCDWASRQSSRIIGPERLCLEFGPGTPRTSLGSAYRSLALDLTSVNKRPILP